MDYTEAEVKDVFERHEVIVDTFEHLANIAGYRDIDYETFEVVDDYVAFRSWDNGHTYRAPLSLFLTSSAKELREYRESEVQAERERERQHREEVESRQRESTIEAARAVLREAGYL